LVSLIVDTHRANAEETGFVAWQGSASSY